jgi:hypothetical protein
MVKTLNNITTKRMENKYYITNRQLRDLNHYQEMFDKVSQEIKELCSNEKSDMEYGFELGKMYHTLCDQHLYMLSLITDIQYQTIEREIIP